MRTGKVKMFNEHPRLRNAMQVRTPGRPRRAKFKTIAHGRIDRCAVAPFIQRQRHHSIIDRGINRRFVINGLLRPFPPQSKASLLSITYPFSAFGGPNAFLSDPG